MERVFFIHRRDNLHKNRGLHNLKSFFEDHKIEVGDLNMGQIKSWFFLKQFFYLVFKLKDEWDLYIVRDPIFVTLLVWFRPDLLKKTLFLSKEMYEFQVPLTSWKLKIRHFVYKNAHYIALKKAPYILFSNALRQGYYYNIIGGDLNRRAAVFEGHYYDDEKSAQDKPPCRAEIITQIDDMRKAHKTIFCYAGSLQPGRDIDLFLGAFRDVDQGSAADADDAFFVVAGYDRGNYEAQIKEMNNAVFLGPLNFPEVHYLYRNSDWGLMNYTNDILNTAYCAPLKLYEFLHFGLGVISNNNIAMKEKSDVISYYYEDQAALAALLEKARDLDPKALQGPEAFDFSQNMIAALAQLGLGVEKLECRTRDAA